MDNDGGGIVSTENKVASEAGHWYAYPGGEPRYTITGKNGKERNTTLRDARQHGFVPSVTTIISIMDKPGLRGYFRRQMYEAAFTTPRPKGMGDDEHFTACCQWADEHAERAREAGTAMHAEIERQLSGEAEWSIITNIIANRLTASSIFLANGKSEHSFAHVDGFGGKVDWHDDAAVVDFKTKDTIPLDGDGKPVSKDGKPARLAWDEHVIQLAAYAYGLGIVAPRCINCFIGVSDGHIVLHEWDAVEITKGLRMFRLCLALWQEKNDWNGAHLPKDVDQRISEAGL
jgi:hypothetical protein